MKPEELAAGLGLAKNHYKLEKLKVPVIDSHLYTTLGRRLFEIYQSHKISPEEQREIERLACLLGIFTLSR